MTKRKLTIRVPGLKSRITMTVADIANGDEQALAQQFLDAASGDRELAEKMMTAAAREMLILQSSMDESPDQLMVMRVARAFGTDFGDLMHEIDARRKEPK